MTGIVEIVGTVLGGGGSLAAIGKGIHFVWTKVEKRFAAIEDELKICRERETASQERRAVQLTVIELLWLALRGVDPNSPALERGKKLLDELKEAD